MLKKYSVEKPNETRKKILEFCSFKCEYSNVCFSLPLSNCCIIHNDIEEFIKSNKGSMDNMICILVKTPCEQCGLIYKIYFKKGKISFNVRNKLCTNSDILSSNGRLICVRCGHENQIRISRFL